MEEIKAKVIEVKDAFIWKGVVRFSLQKNYTPKGVPKGVWRSVEEKTKLTICRGNTRKQCISQTFKILEKKGVIEMIKAIEHSLQGNDSLTSVKRS